MQFVSANICYDNYLNGVHLDPILSFKVLSVVQQLKYLIKEH